MKNKFHVDKGLHRKSKCRRINKKHKLTSHNKENISQEILKWTGVKWGDGSVIKCEQWRPKDLIFGPSGPTGLCGCLVDWLGCLFKPGLMVCSYNLRDRRSLASLAKPDARRHHVSKDKVESGWGRHMMLTSGLNTHVHTRVLYTCVNTYDYVKTFIFKADSSTATMTYWGFVSYLITHMY